MQGLKEQNTPSACRHWEADCTTCTQLRSLTIEAVQEQGQALHGAVQHAHAASPGRRHLGDDRTPRAYSKLATAALAKLALMPPLTSAEPLCRLRTVDPKVLPGMPGVWLPLLLPAHCHPKRAAGPYCNGMLGEGVAPHVPGPRQVQEQRVRLPIQAAREAHQLDVERLDADDAAEAVRFKLQGTQALVRRSAAPLTRFPTTNSQTKLSRKAVLIHNLVIRTSDTTPHVFCNLSSY